MPRYDYCCPTGHIEEQVMGREDSYAPCPICGRIAHRVVMEAPTTIVNIGTVKDKRDKFRRDSAGEHLEGMRRAGAEIKREQGVQSGPFHHRDWEK